MNNLAGFKRIFLCFILLSTAIISMFSQEKSHKKIFLGVNELSFHESRKLYRDYSVYGEYCFTDWAGIGVKGVFEDQKDDELYGRDNKYIIYGLVKAPITKDNEYVFLKPSLGIGYAAGSQKILINASFDINYYLIKDLFYSGVSSSTYIMSGSTFKIYTGINLGFCF